MLNAGFAATEKPTFLKFKAQKQSPHNARNRRIYGGGIFVPGFSGTKRAPE
jgi:hypothetical protein